MNTKLVCAAVALGMSIGVAHAFDAPELKEGLWKIHVQSTDNPGNKKSDGTTMICRNHAYDKSVEALAKSIPGCSPPKESFVGGKYTSEMRCTVSGTVIDSKGTATFHGDTATHSETHATYAPAFYGNTDETMIQDQTFMGPCPAGMGPGDRKLQDGTIQHDTAH